MIVAALTVVIAASVGIIVLGSRFLLTPRRAVRDFGVDADNVRALSAIKGVRDITSGIVVLVVWAAGSRQTLGWVLLAASLTAAGDAVIVRTNGGTLAAALGIHAVTAVALASAGLVLALS